jgi:hypothetical protein
VAESITRSAHNKHKHRRFEGENMEEKDKVNDDINVSEETVNDLPVPDAQAQQAKGGLNGTYDLKPCKKV